jgi:polyphosphate glucokinase
VTTIPIGMDVGGTGIKAAPVDLARGDFAAGRERTPTPQPATPAAIAQVLVDLLARFPQATGPVGITVPGVVRHGVVGSAANIDDSWIGADADALFTEATGREVHVVNDADAAGLAEVQYGAARGRRGLVIVTTLGTGIGSALIHDGVLVPNAELGHLEIDGHDAESRAANSAREREGLSMPQWAERLQRYYETVEMLFSPDLFVVGGGISKQAEEFLPLLDLRTEIVPATLRNRAGVVGAAYYASLGEALGESLGTSLGTALGVERGPGPATASNAAATPPR